MITLVHSTCMSLSVKRFSKQGVSWAVSQVTDGAWDPFASRAVTVEEAKTSSPHSLPSCSLPFSLLRPLIDHDSPFSPIAPLTFSLAFINAQPRSRAAAQPHRCLLHSRGQDGNILTGFAAPRPLLGISFLGSL